jgi:hypothetical protein
MKSLQIDQRKQEKHRTKFQAEAIADLQHDELQRTTDEKREQSLNL